MIRFVVSATLACTLSTVAASGHLLHSSTNKHEPQFCANFCRLGAEQSNTLAHRNAFYASAKIPLTTNSHRLSTEGLSEMSIGTRHQSETLPTSATINTFSLERSDSKASRTISHIPRHLADYDPPFPRLFGMNIGAKDYGKRVYLRQLSRLDIVVFGFYKDWHGISSHRITIQSVIASLRKLNPRMLLGQSTILSESYDNVARYMPKADIINELNKEHWWVRDTAGHKVQWTSQNHEWQTNFTIWAQPDSRGKRFPQWLAQRNYDVFFRLSHGFDIWYSDNVSATQPVGGDWERNGRNQTKSDPVVAAAYRAGEESYWAAARKLDPHILIIGNANNDLGFPAYRDKLNGVFLEGLMGFSWSIFQVHGWNSMMIRYHTVFRNLLKPRIVGFNVWGSLTDYRFFRFAYTSCLMDNGYFSYTDRSVGYSSLPWFDEYDVKLGYPIDPPQTAPWEHGVYKRTFQYGLALVNPTEKPETVTLPPHRWRHFYGSQDPAVNDGKPVITVTLASEDGVILVKDNVSHR